jgi:hypothetical protein
LLSGSANFTWTDTHSNRNNVFVFGNASVWRQDQAEVEQLQRGSFGRGLHGEVPKTSDLAGVPVRVLFAPDHTPELEIMKQLLKGSRECYFAVFTFAGSSGIDDAMLALARGGMQLKGALDPGQAAQDWAAPQVAQAPQHRAVCPQAGRPRRLNDPALVGNPRPIPWPGSLHGRVIVENDGGPMRNRPMSWTGGCAETLRPGPEGARDRDDTARRADR